MAFVGIGIIKAVGIRIEVRHEGVAVCLTQRTEL